MKCLLSVSLATLAVATSFVVSEVGRSQDLQKGVSVQMAVTNHATAMPEADSTGAWIVAVTADGKLYFGADPVRPDGLFEAMKVRPRNRAAKLYIKADARAPFRSVNKVLEAGQEALFESAVLLTSQPEQATPGAMVPPKGLEVGVGAALNADAIVVQVHSGQRTPMLQINHEDVSWAIMQSTLIRLLQNEGGKGVEVRADGSVPFTVVASVIDACRSAGAKVVVGGPEI